ISLLSKYLEIARENFNRIKPLENEIESIMLHVDPDRDSYLARKDAFDKISSYFNQICKHSITTIVFCALAVEAFIYDYGARNTSDTYIQKYVDKLDTISKWVVIPKLVTGKEFPKENQSFELLSRLVKNRNSLVHHKAVNVEFGSKDFEQKYKKVMGDLPLKAKEAITVFSELISDLKKVDSNLNINDYGFKEL
ncbi:MAG: hypothetical protein ACYC21_02390, partial [Eubacteriales bacterium]